MEATKEAFEPWPDTLLYPFSHTSRSRPVTQQIQQLIYRYLDNIHVHTILDTSFFQQCRVPKSMCVFITYYTICNPQQDVEFIKVANTFVRGLSHWWGIGVICRAMTCFEWNLHIQISGEDSILSTTFSGDHKYILLLLGSSFIMYYYAQLWYFWFLSKICKIVH